MGNLPSELQGPDELDQYWLLLTNGEKIFIRWEPACQWWFWRPAASPIAPNNNNAQVESVYAGLDIAEWRAVAPSEPWDNAEYALCRALPQVVGRGPAPQVAFPDLKDLNELCAFKDDFFVRPATYGNSMPVITPIWYRYTASEGWSWSPYFPAPEWIPVSRTTVTSGPWTGASPAGQNLTIIRALDHQRPRPGAGATALN